jgi:DNA invertase Pin-like site-specific DNA recombinase
MYALVCSISARNVSSSRSRSTDQVAAKNTQRPQLAALLAFVRDGDTVVVHSMNRLARNLEDLRRLVRELTARGVRSIVTRRAQAAAFLLSQRHLAPQAQTRVSVTRREKTV